MIGISILVYDVPTNSPNMRWPPRPLMPAISWSTRGVHLVKRLRLLGAFFHEQCSGQNARCKGNGHLNPPGRLLVTPLYAGKGYGFMLKKLYRKAVAMVNSRRLAFAGTVGLSSRPGWPAIGC